MLSPAGAVADAISAAGAVALPEGWLRMCTTSRPADALLLVNWLDPGEPEHALAAAHEPPLSRRFRTALDGDSKCCTYLHHA
jgi:hypothetical protein